MTWQGQPQARTAAWQSLRQQILERDHGICWLCGQPGADQVDHKVNRAAGGTDDPDNLAPAHRACHLRKSSAEGNAARSRQRTTRDPEKHPGLKW
jgi:5-methylcytosine-specific restriction protein A